MESREEREEESSVRVGVVRGWEGGGSMAE